MSKRILIVIGALVVVILGATLASIALQPSGPPSAQSSATPSQGPNLSTPSTPSAEAVEAAPEATPGAYVEYSTSAIADAEGTALLFFHAPWCPQCRAVEDDILSMGVPDGVTIIKVDYDSNQGIRQQYGVTLQTTFVKVDSSGNGLQTFVAYEDPRLAAVLDAML